MKFYIVSYVATAVIFLGMDAIWLTLAGPRLYRPQLGDLLLENYRLAPAAIFYLLYVVGILIFAVQPAAASGRWQTALLYGALFGFFAYGTYDFTNLATLKGWSLADHVRRSGLGDAGDRRFRGPGLLIVSAIVRS